MNSLLLTTLARGLVWLMFLSSLYLLYRGHNNPGGGFIGGLVGAVAIALAAKGLGHAEALRLLRLKPRDWIAAGILIALASGCFSLLFDKPLFTGIWGEIGGVPIANILFFDIGVYFIVLGATLTFFFCLEDPES